MTSFPQPHEAVPRLRLGIVVVLAFLASPLLPAASVALAQSALYPGAVGFVANASGEAVLVRETPSFDAAVLSSFPVGTPADIVEGPLYGNDGTAWYGVAVGGVTGYMVAGNLVDTGQAAAPAPVELAQEAVDAGLEPVTPEADVAVAAPGDVAANPVTTSELNFRSGPSYNAQVLQIIPAGAALFSTGDWSEGFVRVSYQGQTGWVDSQWLSFDGVAPQAAPLLQEAAPVAEAVPVTQTATVAEDAPVVDPAAAPGGNVAYAVDTANLRLGPSESDEVLRVLPAGGAVTITGAPSGGWTPVWYNGSWGFISSDLLTADTTGAVSLAQEAALDAVAVGESYDAVAPAVTSESGAMQATTLSDVNLRGGPEMTAPVLGAIPAGVTLDALAGPEAGFYQVQYGGQTGWVSGDYVDVSASYLQRGDRRDQEGKVEGSEPAANANANLGAGGIIWPVSGGLWYVMQGYNGSSHQNQDGLFQYYYSLDLARRDGNTAGQQVISPVNGVVRWTDPGSGGISIDIGNGHAVAMFHVTFMGGLQAGTPVQQGQSLGTISGPGGPGFAGTPHLHFTLWQSSDNGNWDRQAVPFTGPYAISGMEFPDIGGGSQYRGTEFSP